MHAIVVRFDHQLPPYSDEEGLVPGRVEDAGFDRRATLVTPDRREVVVTVGDESLEERRFDKLLSLLADGWDPSPIIHKDIAYAPPEIWAMAGPEGEPVEGIERVEWRDVDTDNLVHSAAIAAREEGGA